MVVVSLVVFVGMVVAQQPAAKQNGQNSGLPEVAAAQAALGSTPAPTGSAAPTKQADQATPDQISNVKLGPGDLIEVSVYNVPELATKARVSTNGDIYLPLIDYVHVEGRTQEETQSVTQKPLEDGGFVRNPHMTIFVDEAAWQGVAVRGEVMKPGIFPDTVNRKLYEVISEAGGFTAAASRKIAIIRRSQPELIRVDLPRNVADDLGGNVEVLPSDTSQCRRHPSFTWWET